MARTKSKYTPPPAPKGNKYNLVHGAKAEPPAAKVRAIEDALYASLAASAPVRVGNNQLPPADAHTVRLAARTLARLESVSAWIDEHGPLDKNGKPRSAANWERRLTATAAKLLSSLGMNPQARAKLHVALQQGDLARAMSNPDPVAKARELKDLGLPYDAEATAVDE
ncbi:MAG TPA: P27 family phage terminase small subunit [Solirubrobacteraceae bacterium]|jgi:hypothetical protein|nr:P27 family phage terminase small subunit [Solirubrobacteraceae bacterium]